MSLCELVLCRDFSAAAAALPTLFRAGLRDGSALRLFREAETAAAEQCQAGIHRGGVELYAALALDLLEGALKAERRAVGAWAEIASTMSATAMMRAPMQMSPSFSPSG